MTWGELNPASGTVTLSCVGAQTQIVVNATGLVPGALYNGVIRFNEPPGAREGGGPAITGFVPIGDPSGSNALVTATPLGTAQWTALMSSEPMVVSLDSRLTQTPPCLLDAYEFMVTILLSFDPSNPLQNSIAHLVWIFREGVVEIP